jgi:hypothetical protein
VQFRFTCFDSVKLPFGLITIQQVSIKLLKKLSSAWKTARMQINGQQHLAGILFFCCGLLKQQSYKKVADGNWEKPLNACV